MSKKDIRIVKLVTGEELVTAVNGVTNGDMVLENPLLITEDYDEETGASIMVLQRYVIFDDDQKTYVINKIHVVSASNASDEMAEYYVHNVELQKSKYDPMFKSKIIQSIGQITEYLGKGQELDNGNVIKGNFVRGPSTLN